MTGRHARRGTERWIVEVSDSDGRASLGERLRDGKADALRAAGHERHAAIQPKAIKISHGRNFAAGIAGSLIVASAASL